MSILRRSKGKLARLADKLGMTMKETASGFIVFPCKSGFEKPRAVRYQIDREYCARCGFHKSVHDKIKT